MPSSAAKTWPRFTPICTGTREGCGRDAPERPQHLPFVVLARRRHARRADELAAVDVESTVSIVTRSSSSAACTVRMRSSRAAAASSMPRASRPVPEKRTKAIVATRWPGCGLWASVAANPAGRSARSTASPARRRSAGRRDSSGRRRPTPPEQSVRRRHAAWWRPREAGRQSRGSRGSVRSGRRFGGDRRSDGRAHDDELAMGAPTRNRWTSPLWIPTDIDRCSRPTEVDRVRVTELTAHLDGRPRRLRRGSPLGRGTGARRRRT